MSTYTFSENSSLESFNSIQCVPYLIDNQNEYNLFSLFQTAIFYSITYLMMILILIDILPFTRIVILCFQRVFV